MSNEEERDRPSDPAGTQPKVDPASLVWRGRNLLPPATTEGEPSEGEGEGDERLLPERLAHADVPGPVVAATEAPQAKRFHILTGAVLGVGIACIAAFAILLIAGGGKDEKSRPWSTWKPVSASLAQASDQIARHVGPTYHRTTADQLALVSGGPPSIEAAGNGGSPLPLHIVLRNASDGSYSEESGKSVLYRLCGLGQDCAIAGQPSAARWLLIRRQALELALYSFRYIDGLDHVLVMLPPTVPAQSAGTTAEQQEAADQAATRVLFFRRGDLRDHLSRPLDKTLPGKPPLPATVRRSAGVRTVERVTASRLFTYGLQPSNGDNSAFLILERA